MMGITQVFCTIIAYTESVRELILQGNQVNWILHCFAYDRVQEEMVWTRKSAKKKTMKIVTSYFKGESGDCDRLDYLVALEASLHW